MQDRKGFTLIELLIVVVIIGILAAIAIPKFSATREKAYVSAMKSDLKNLATQQEIYYSDNYSYGTLADVDGQLSEGVALVSETSSATGWSAVVEHSGTDQDCALFDGDAVAVAPATQRGVVTCG